MIFTPKSGIFVCFSFLYVSLITISGVIFAMKAQKMGQGGHYLMILEVGGEQARIKPQYFFNSKLVKLENGEAKIVKKTIDLLEDGAEEALEGLDDLQEEIQGPSDHEMVADLIQIARKIGYGRFFKDNKLLKICAEAIEKGDKIKRTMQEYSLKKKNIVKKKSALSGMVSQLIPDTLEHFVGPVGKEFMKYLSERDNQLEAGYETAQQEATKANKNVKTQRKVNYCLLITNCITGLATIATALVTASEIWTKYLSTL